MIISINTQKTFDKIQHQLLIETLSKLGIEELPHLLKVIKNLWLMTLVKLNN